MAYTSFRTLDSRAFTDYVVNDGQIISTDRNYCVELLKAHRLPVVIGGRIYVDGEMTDRTDDVIADLAKYAEFDFTDLPELAFLGKKC